MTDLEARLRALGPDLDVPEAPELAVAVRRRIEGVVPLRRSRPARALRTAGLAAAAVLLLAGTAVGTRFLLRGVEIVPAPPQGVSPAPPGEGLALGEAVTLEEARAAVPFDLGVPEALGEPDGIFIDTTMPDGRVTMVYEPRPGLPADAASGLGALLMQLHGSVDEGALVGKVPADGAPVEVVGVGGAAAYWLEGPHVVYLRDATGKVRADTVRLAGNVLLWQRGEVTLRLESDLTRDRAIAIAESVR